MIGSTMGRDRVDGRGTWGRHSFGSAGMDEPGTDGDVGADVGVDMGRPSIAPRCRAPSWAAISSGP